MLQREEGLQREAGPQCVYSAHTVEKANELANVEKSIFEHRDLLRQISSYHHRPRRDPHAVTCQKCIADCLNQCEELLNKYGKLAGLFSGDGNDGRTEELPGDKREEHVCGEEEEEEDAIQRRPSYTPQLIKAKSAKCFDKRLKTLQELCDDHFYKATVDLLHETEKIFRGDLSYLHTRRLERELHRKQKVTNFLFEEDPDSDEGDGERLKPCCAVDHAVPNDDLSHPPPTVLGKELDGKEPSDLLGLMDSRLESSASDQTPETQESSEETKGSFSSQKSGRDQAETPQNSASEAPDSDPTQDLNTDPDRETSSEEIDTTNGEDEDEGDQTPVSLLEVASELEDAETLTDAAAAAAAAAATDLQPDAPVDAACCMTQNSFLYQDSAPEAALRHRRRSRRQRAADGVVNQEPQALLSLPDHQAVGPPASGGIAANGLELPVGLHADSGSRSSVEDGSDSAMSVSVGTDRAASPLGCGRLVAASHRKKAGQGALRFVRQYPFAVQAIWCLLSGRSLVVLGADEGRVRRLVAALALYLPAPGRCGERVQPWLSCPFTLTDLQRWKLIGLQRYLPLYLNNTTSCKSTASNCQTNVYLQLNLTKRLSELFSTVLIVMWFFSQSSVSAGL